MGKDHNQHRHHEHDPPSQPGGPAPPAFIAELLHGQYTSPCKPPILPEGYAFNVSWGPQFNEGIIRSACSQTTGLSDGRVGFVFNDPHRPVNVRFLYQPQPPGGWLAATFRHEDAGVVRGFDIALGFLDGYDEHGVKVHWPDAIKPFMHELGHGTYGFGHVHPDLYQADPCIMGGADAYQSQWNPWEKGSWKQKLELKAAFLASLLTPEAHNTTVFCRF